MLLAQVGVVEERLRKLLDDASKDLPAGGAKGGSKRQAAGQEEKVINDEGKGAQDVGVVLQLTKTAFDVVGVYNYVEGGVRYAQVIDACIQS